jgi:hypothetical protein
MLGKGARFPAQGRRKGCPDPGNIWQSQKAAALELDNPAGIFSTLRSIGYALSARILARFYSTGRLDRPKTKSVADAQEDEVQGFLVQSHSL